MGDEEGNLFITITYILHYSVEIIISSNYQSMRLMQQTLLLSFHQINHYAKKSIYYRRPSCSYAHPVIQYCLCPKSETQ